MFDTLRVQECADPLTPVPCSTAGDAPHEPLATAAAKPRSFFIQTYGCQMNVSDSELVVSILQDSGYRPAAEREDADVVLLNTCAIRDKAEARIWGQLQRLKYERDTQQRRQTVGLLGCMAERLKDKLLDGGMVDVIAGARTRTTGFDRQVAVRRQISRDCECMHGSDYSVAVIGRHWHRYGLHALLRAALVLF